MQFHWFWNSEENQLFLSQMHKKARIYYHIWSKLPNIESCIKDSTRRTSLAFVTVQWAGKSNKSNPPVKMDSSFDQRKNQSKDKRRHIEANDTTKLSQNSFFSGPNSCFGIDNCIYKFSNMLCFEKDFSNLALLFSWRIFLRMNK